MLSLVPNFVHGNNNLKSIIHLSLEDIKCVVCQLCTFNLSYDKGRTNLEHLVLSEELKKHVYQTLKYSDKRTENVQIVIEIDIKVE